MLSMLTITAVFLSVFLTGTMAVTARGLRTEHRTVQAKLREKGGFSRD